MSAWGLSLSDRVFPVLTLADIISAQHACTCPQSPNTDQSGFGLGHAVARTATCQRGEVGSAVLGSTSPGNWVRDT